MEISDNEFYQIIIVVLVVFGALFIHKRHQTLALENSELKRRLEEARRR